MMFYVSIADDHTGKWIGGCYVNAPTQEEAGIRAAALAGGDRCLEMAMVPVPPGSPGIPAQMYGRLLDRAELVAAAGARLMDFTITDDGVVERSTP